MNAVASTQPIVAEPPKRKRTLEDLDPIERMEYEERLDRLQKQRAETRVQIDRQRVEQVTYALDLLKTNGWFQPNDNVLLETVIRQVAHNTVTSGDGSEASAVSMTPTHVTILEAAADLRMSLPNSEASSVGRRISQLMKSKKVDPEKVPRTQPSGLGNFEVNSWPVRSKDRQESYIPLILKAFEEIVPEKYQKSLEGGHVDAFKSKYLK
jgi:hypothetical protein